MLLVTANNLNLKIIMEKRPTLKPAMDLAYLAQFMRGLHENQRKLHEIKSAYDNLALLGQLLCAGTDISGMRTDFNELAGVLLDQLTQELRKKAVLSLGSRARVAIDILIRNLFERTADIGFLATDTDIRSFAEAVAHDPAVAGDSHRVGVLNTRFSEYIRKYSVYHNIILLAPDGRVLAQLDKKNPVTACGDPLIGESLNTDQPYVETFRASDLLPNEASPLIYSCRVMSADGSHPVGVLCLCFRFQDECQRIFRGLVTEDDWTVVTILARDGSVIASSDMHQFPLGAKTELGVGEGRIMRFAGREYLATTRETHGYQGYAGPGWLGQTLSPLNHAFEMGFAHELEQVPESLLEGVLETTTLFSSELRDTPLRANRIKRELDRAVWNGNIWLTRDSYALNTSFAKVLLREIGSTGVHTLNVFSESTTNLYETVVSSVLYDCSSQAALAIDIMDRNLYERANDCRWWALTSAFRDILHGHTGEDGLQRARLTDILRTINGLYTVYSNLLIFDASARVVAVSNPACEDLVGQTLQTDWVRQTLGLPDTQSYCVSSFTPSHLYANHPTYVYSAAIREPGAGNTPVGGIAVVFDSTPQFAAMLQDALPRKEDGSIVDGAFAVFAEADGRIIASTDALLEPGMTLAISREFFELANGEGCTNIVVFRDRYYAVGSRMSAGYREYKNDGDAYRNDVAALVLAPLSDQVLKPQDRQSLRCLRPDNYAARQACDTNAVEIATFYIGGDWYGVHSNCVLEAIEGQAVIRIPGMPAWVRGWVMYNDQAIMVFDLSCFLPESSQASESSQIVVIKMPGQQTSYGMLVDELGEIAEIASARIEPLADIMGQGYSLTESLVKPRPGEADGRILAVLSAQRILHRLTGLSVPGLECAHDDEFAPSSK